MTRQPATPRPPATTPPQLTMRRRHLRDLPPIVLPEGYALRTYRPGDETAWCEIMNHGLSGGPDKPWTAALCREKLVERPQFSADALYFVTRSDDAGHDEPVASATAWRQPVDDFETGYVHMVCALPEHRGKSLGYIATLATLHHFAARGFKRALLNTDDHRLAAIRTYLNLGFVPSYDHPSHAERWLAIYSRIAERYPTAPRPNPPAAFGPIGYVANAVVEPVHEGWSEVVSEIEVEPHLAEALDGIESRERVTVVFWLDRVTDEQRGIRKLHPRDRADLPLTGVFATRSQYRPNPIGVSVAQVLERRGNRLVVRGLDAVDGTPVLDLKGAD